MICVVCVVSHAGWLMSASVVDQRVWGGPWRRGFFAADGAPSPLAVATRHPYVGWKGRGSKCGSGSSWGDRRQNPPRDSGRGYVARCGLRAGSAEVQGWLSGKQTWGLDSGGVWVGFRMVTIIRCQLGVFSVADVEFFFVRIARWHEYGKASGYTADQVPELVEQCATTSTAVKCFPPPSIQISTSLPLTTAGRRSKFSTLRQDYTTGRVRCHPGRVRRCSALQAPVA